MNVVDLLLKLLSYESITPDDAGSLKFIEEYLDGYEATYVNLKDRTSVSQVMLMSYLQVMIGKPILLFLSLKRVISMHAAHKI